MKNKIIGERIKAIRKEKGLTAKEFGKIIGAPQSAVSNWENGANLPNSERLKAIADFAGITVDELLSSEEKANTDLPLYNGELLEILLNETIKINKALFNERLEENANMHKRVIDAKLKQAKDEKSKEETKKLEEWLTDNLKKTQKKMLEFIANLEKLLDSVKKSKLPFYIYNHTFYSNLDNINDLSKYNINDDDLAVQIVKYNLIVVRDLSLEDDEHNIIYNKKYFTGNDFVSIVKKYFDHGIRIELY